MNSSDGKRESAKGRLIKGIGICLCFLILGFFLGIALDARYRPNLINLVIGPDNKVGIAPQSGDIILWSAADPKVTSLKIKFTADQAPCVPNMGMPGSACVYDPIEGGPSTYPFSCSMDQGPDACAGTAFHVGPRCPICPPWDDVIGSNPWHAGVWDLQRLFGPMRPMSPTPPSPGQ